MNIYSKQDKTWYNFCGKVNLEKSKGNNFLKKFKDEDIYASNKDYLNIKDTEREKYIKIDCFMKKYIILKFLLQ